ncbi:MAG: hypothetical protein MUC38_13435 [Cyclobacteriaceae bacterium]|jgi:hypothetical protein|nr:hypothetical protein [Cyclobacteriaceae bacterium]
MKYLLFILSLLPFAAVATPPDSAQVVTHLDSVFHVRVLEEPAPEMADVLVEEVTLDEVNNGEEEQKIALVRTMMAKVRETQNFIRSIDASSRFELPVGISKSIGGLNYDIVIYAVRLQPTHAELDVVMEFEIPQNGKKLAFMGRNIKLSNAGGIVGDATLQLIGSYGINFNGDKVQLVINGGTEQLPGTYVTMDCDGFKEMALDANVIFSRDLLIPENLNM